LAGKKYLISEAYFTFVALDKNGKAAPVNTVKLVTLSEQEQFTAALKRRESIVKKKKKTQQLLS
jgi:acyl-CoA hydrolase